MSVAKRVSEEFGCCLGQEVRNALGRVGEVPSEEGRVAGNLAENFVRDGDCDADRRLGGAHLRNSVLANFRPCSCSQRHVFPHTLRVISAPITCTWDK